MAQKMKQLAELLPPLKGWTIETYAAHNEAMRAADIRFHEERDRRYAEGAALNAIALKIKETADLAALTLAREGSTLDQARLDALRDKTLGDSGVYATNASVSLALTDLKTSFDTALAPIVDFISKQQGASQGVDLTWGKIGAVLGILFAGWIALRSGTHPVLP